MTSPALSPDIQAASRLMGTAQGTLVVGPKAPSTRRWRKVAWDNIVLATGLGMVSLLGASALAQKMGMLQELEAWKAPAAQVTSAPEHIKWVAMARSPFLDAGYDAAGNFSVPHMLEAWRDAGMSVPGAWLALGEVAHLRPVLMGRADPVLERQLQADAANASRRLGALFPHVQEALARQASGVDEGYLSPVVVDPMAWATALPRMEQRLSQGEQARDWKLSVLVERAVDWNRVSSPEQSLAFSPYLEVGFQDGAWSMDRMLQAWRRAGMDGFTAQFILDELARTLPDVAGLPIVDRKEKVEQARETLQGLAQMAPEITERLPRAANGEIFAPVSDEFTVGISGLEMQQAWDEASRFDEDRPAPPPRVASMADAKKMLAQAVERTGLRALTLSLDQWQSPDTVAQAARNLVQANAMLERATGWQGKVLGLDGRVELALGAPIQAPGANGVATADLSGRLQVVAEWQALGHEWYHGFDYVISRMVMTHSLQQPLSNNLGAWRLVEKHGPYQAMENLVRATSEQAPSWTREREIVAAATKSRSAYWVDPAEVLAFGFGAHLKHNLDARLIVDPSPGAPLAPAPGLAESQALAPFYTAMFDAAAPLGLAGQPSVEVRMDPGQWRAQRASPIQPEAPEPTPRRATLR